MLIALWLPGGKWSERTFTPGRLLSAGLCWQPLASAVVPLEACSPPPARRGQAAVLGSLPWGKGCSSESHPASGILLKLQALLVSFVGEAPPWLRKGSFDGFPQPQPLLCTGTFRVPGPPQVEPATADLKARAPCLPAGERVPSRMLQWQLRGTCSGMRAPPGPLRGEASPSPEGKGDIRPPWAPGAAVGTDMDEMVAPGGTKGRKGAKHSGLSRSPRP